MPKKSAKRPPRRLKSNATVTEDSIIIALTDEQKKKARDSIRKTGVAKFKIQEITVKAIPSARVKVEWIQQD